MTQLSQPRIVCAAILMMALSGCSDPWGASAKNDTRISEYHKCLEADMSPYMNMVGEIVCGVPDENE